MRLGIRAHDVEKLSLEPLFAKIHEQGFHCTQLALGKAVYDFKVDNGMMTPGFAMYLKELCTEYKVDICVLGCYLNLCNPDPVKHAQIVEKYKTHIRFASWLGCAVVGTETGAVNVDYKYEPANHSEEALQTFIENLRPIVEYCEKMGVVFAIEPVYKHIVCNVERARRVLDAINSPNLQIIFDPVNLLSVDNCKDQDQIIKDAFDILGDDIAVIHCKDYKIEDGEIISIPAGTGSFNYPLLMKYIKERKPYVHISLENTKPENALQTRDFMEELYANS